MQSQGFKVEEREKTVCRLQKSLYGLKHASRQQYKKFDGLMNTNGFIRSQVDNCFCINNLDNSYIILLLYVDDMLIAGAFKQKIDTLKKKKVF